jgi:hypothetical protein
MVVLRALARNALYVLSRFPCLLVLTPKHRRQVFRGVFFLVAVWNLFLECILSEADQANPML